MGRLSNKPPLVEIFKEIFPDFEVTKYQTINSKLVKIWCDKWVYIFEYKTSTDWALMTIKNWEREMKGD